MNKATRCGHAISIIAAIFWVVPVCSSEHPEFREIFRAIEVNETPLVIFVVFDEAIDEKSSLFGIDRVHKFLSENKIKSSSGIIDLVRAKNSPIDIWHVGVISGRYRQLGFFAPEPDRHIRIGYFCWTTPYIFYLPPDDDRAGLNDIVWKAKRYDGDVWPIWVRSRGLILQDRLVPLDGYNQQKANYAEEAKPKAQNSIVAVPSTDGKTPQQNTTNDREPEYGEGHKFSLHDLLRVTLSGMLAGFATGIFIGIWFASVSRKFR